MLGMSRLSESRLLPRPRSVTDAEGEWTPDRHGTVGLGRTEPPVLWAATGLTDALGAATGGQWDAAAGAAEAPVSVHVDPRAVPHAQGYRLTVAPDAVHIIAADAAGAQYGLLALTQLLAEHGDRLPAGRLDDYPDFAVRGVMLDISRDKVPTMATLFDLVDLLASLRVNHFQLYTEHTFAYPDHRRVWAAASPMTAEQILELDAYCRDRGVELAPNQNGFGHMERWLWLPRYRPLAEVHGHPEAIHRPRGYGRFGCTLCPIDPEAERLMGSLYEQLLPNFTSKRFNIGGDEPRELGKGRSKAECDRRGVGEVYVDFLGRLIGHVQRLGRVPMYWGDIVMHHPEVLERLPKQDAIALEWGYSHNHDFDGRCAKYAAAGVPMWVCPGTGTWLSLVGRTAQAVANLRAAAVDGPRHGAGGFLNTNWGDRGHWQPISTAYGPFAYGAAVSWCAQTNAEPDWTAVGMHVFEDPSGEAGRIMADLGRLHEISGPGVGNTAIVALMIVPDGPRWDGQIITERLTDAVDRADALLGDLREADIRRHDADQIVEEMTVAVGLYQHGCRFAARKLAGGGPTWTALDVELAGLIGRYCGTWLARNRPGGLADSVARFQRLRAHYRAADEAAD
jgi:hypothetical protein